MGLFAAIGIGAKVVKGLWKKGRAKRKAKRAAKKAKKAANLQSQAEASLSSLGFGAMPDKLTGNPAFQTALSAVQSNVFDTPNMDANSDDATTSFTSTGGRIQELVWYQKIPMWVWMVAGGVLVVPLLIVLIVKLFKR
jgi:hypothetical protein